MLPSPDEQINAWYLIVVLLGGGGLLAWRVVRAWRHNTPGVRDKIITNALNTVVTSLFIGLWIGVAVIIENWEHTSNWVVGISVVLGVLVAWRMAYKRFRRKANYAIALVVGGLGFQVVGLVTVAFGILLLEIVFALRRLQRLAEEAKAARENLNSSVPPAMPH